MYTVKKYGIGEIHQLYTLFGWEEGKDKLCTVGCLRLGNELVVYGKLCWAMGRNVFHIRCLELREKFLEYRMQDGDGERSSAYMLPGAR